MREFSRKSSFSTLRTTTSQFPYLLPAECLDASGRRRARDWRVGHNVSKLYCITWLERWLAVCVTLLTTESCLYLWQTLLCLKNDRSLVHKRVTEGEVDTWGKELGKCTHQWTTNDEKNKQALSTLNVFCRLKKKDRQQQKEERSREEDRREGGNQTESKAWFPPSRLSSASFFLLLSVFLL